MGATEKAIGGVANWMPMLGSGAARSVAPVGPTLMPGAVGMPSLDVVGGAPASAAAPPEEPPEPDDDAVEPELLPLPPLLAVALPPPLLVPEEPVALPPLLPVVMLVELGSCELGKPLVLGPAELQARKPTASSKPAPDRTRFTLDVCIMTRLRLSLASLGAPSTTHPRGNSYHQLPDRQRLR